MFAGEMVFIKSDEHHFLLAQPMLNFAFESL